MTEATPAKRRTPRREGVAVLETITYLAGASTPWTELYHALSDTTPGKVYEVRLDTNDGTWHCQCLGATRGHTCRHIKRADRKRRVRYFSALWAGQPPAFLRRQRAHFQERADTGMADADALAALDYLTLALARLEAA